MLLLSELDRGDVESALAAREHLLEIQALELEMHALKLAGLSHKLGRVEADLEEAIRLEPIREQLQVLDRARKRGAQASVEKRRKAADDVAYSIVQEAKQKIETARKNGTLLDYRKLSSEIAEWGFTLFDSTTKRPKLDKKGFKQRIQRSEDIVRAALQEAKIIPAKKSRKRA